MASTQKSDYAKANNQPPDLVVFQGTTYFAGYYPGFSIAGAVNGGDALSTLVLRAHTKNRAGTVKLNSNDPRDVPDINFHYFNEGTDTAGLDLDAVEQALLYIRNNLNMQPKFRSNYYVQEIGPMAKYSDSQLRQGIMDEAWGHHACCSNPMGLTSDDNAVVDSKFRVIGVKNLRVVDCSIFPNIPGYFVMVPIYMISEKATDDILRTAGATPYVP